jgi:hypothetical protein
MCNQPTPKKYKWLVGLVITIIVDIVATASLLYINYFEHKKNAIQFQFFFDFTTKTFDITFLCVIRILCVIIATKFALDVGDEEKYVRMEIAYRQRKQQLQNPTDYVVLQGFDNNENIEESKTNEFMEIIKEPLGPGARRGTTTVLRQTKSLNVKKLTTHRKNIVFGVVFVFCTACSIFTGIKCITFSFIGNNVEQIISALLLCTLPIWMNLSFFLMRNFVNEAVKKQGRFFKGVHHHHLHLRDLPCSTLHSTLDSTHSFSH